MVATDGDEGERAWPGRYSRERKRHKGRKHVAIWSPGERVRSQMGGHAAAGRGRGPEAGRLGKQAAHPVVLSVLSDVRLPRGRVCLCTVCSRTVIAGGDGRMCRGALRLGTAAVRPILTTTSALPTPDPPAAPGDGDVVDTRMQMKQVLLLEHLLGALWLGAPRREGASHGRALKRVKDISGMIVNTSRCAARR